MEAVYYDANYRLLRLTAFDIYSINVSEADPLYPVHCESTKQYMCVLLVSFKRESKFHVLQ